eukprot:TRINITY_DN2956_c0_g1_i1.p1 TRINITY_DN2956_c0_g1~~TRINITY_DN2956_c0_g1_i1.p1  ORF type:complete len:499 (+),score=141.07 TRINITY_DN2956_c0_g1_i1:214-1710(+)
MIRGLLSPITCKAPNLPLTLNDPGLIDSEGFLDLDLHPFFESENRKIHFTLTKTSLFRVHVPAHRIDIDLKLIHKSGARITSSSERYLDENIFVSLEAGDYILLVQVFVEPNPNSLPKFCATYDISISIAPGSAVESTGRAQCLNAAGTTKKYLPKFDGMQQAIKDSPHVWALDDEENTAYYFPMESTHSNIQVVLQTFTTDEELSLRSTLTSNFLLSGLAMWITNDEKNKEVFATASRHRSTSYLNTKPPPGTYTLHIATYSSAVVHLDAVALPSCVSFGLTFSLRPADMILMGECSGRFLPTSLNIPGQLDEFNKVHIPGEYGMAARNYETGFTVDKESTLRLYTDSGVTSGLNVDIQLLEDRIPIHNSTLRIEGKTLFAPRLSPNRNYALVMTPHFSNVQHRECTRWSVELAIEPTPQLQGTCLSEKLPTAKIDSPVASRGYYYSSKFSFQQKSQAAEITSNFTAGEELYFRAAIRYNFLANDLDLKPYKVYPDF